jgi:hypothetical protein
MKGKKRNNSIKARKKNIESNIFAFEKGQGKTFKIARNFEFSCKHGRNAGI